MANDSKVIEVAAALVFRDGKLLIAQRPPTGHLANLWEFPGGKRERSETFEDCLKREVLEELGLEISVGQLVEAITHSYPEKTVHLRFYQCGWVRNEPRAIGCQAFRWIEAHELAQFEFPPADARLLSQLRADPGLWRG